MCGPRIWYQSCGSELGRAVRISSFSARLFGLMRSIVGDVTSKYYVIDGVEALQKFGQDAWCVALALLL